MTARQIGDIILDHYLPNATPEEREAARENLRLLARLILDVHERLNRGNPQHATRASESPAVESDSAAPGL